MFIKGIEIEIPNYNTEKLNKILELIKINSYSTNFSLEVEALSGYSNLSMSGRISQDVMHKILEIIDTKE